jgi:hypothetical protein
MTGDNKYFTVMTALIPGVCPLWLIEASTGKNILNQFV